MIIRKEQAEKRISSEDNIVNQLNKSQAVEVIVDNRINNKEGNTGSHHLTEEQRIQVGTLASLEGNQVAADVFGLSVSHVSDIKNASRNIGAGEHGKSLRTVDQNLKKQIQDRLEDVKLTASERAAERLLASLGFMTNDKLENCTAKDLAGIAAQTSNVIRNMNGNNKGDEGKKGSNVRIVLNRPREANEDSFDVIEVQAS